MQRVGEGHPSVHIFNKHGALAFSVVLKIVRYSTYEVIYGRTCIYSVMCIYSYVKPYIRVFGKCLSSILRKFLNTVMQHAVNQYSNI